MPDYVVSTAFKASDKVSPALAKMNKSVKLFGGTAEKAFKRAGKGASMFRSLTAANLLSRGITSAMMFARRGIEEVITSFVSFDDAIGQSAAKFPVKIMRGTQAFEDLGAAARQVGATTKYTATEAAEGLNFLAMAGFNADQAVKALPGVVQLATAANMDLAYATDVASDSLGAFGLMTEDTAQLQLNLTRVNDVFAKTANTANTNVAQLFEAVREGGPVFKTAGQSMETFSALAGKLAGAGKKGGAAGTVLKNAILKLTGATGPGKKKLEELGVEVNDAGGNMRDITDIIEDLRLATKEMGSGQKSAALDVIFGKRAIAGMSYLIDQGGDSLKEYRTQLEGAGGSAAELASEIEKSLGNKLKSLQSALLEVGFKFLEAFSGEGVEGLDGIIEAVRKFDVKPLVEGAQEVLKAFKWLFRTIKNNWELIKGLTKLFIGLKIAMVGIGLVKWGAGIFGSVQGIMARVTAMNKLGVAAGKATQAGGAAGGAVTGGAGAGAMVGGGLAAGAAGYAIGTMLREAIFEPIYQDMEKTGTNIENASVKIENSLMGFGGAAKPTTEQLLAMQKQLAGMKEDVPLMTFSLENAFGGIASLFTDQKSPVEIYFDRQKKIGELNMMVAASLERLKLAANNAANAPNAGTGSGQFKGQLDINGAPAGSTYQDTSKPGAPKVDVTLAGKNT